MPNRLGPRLDESPLGITDTISRADRAASRSVSIAVFTLLGGVAAYVLMTITKQNHHHNGLLPLAVPPAMLVGHGCGLFQAIAALRGQTTRKTQATVGLAMNGLLFAILLLLIAVVVVLVGVWAQIGR